jgi:predicted Zn-dependent protease with MMP-like domain
MQARPVAGDEPGATVCYAVQLHVLMSQAEMQLWKSLADRRRLDVDDVVHAAALSGLTYQLKHATDEIVTDVAAVSEGELIARLGLEDIAPDRSSV